MMPTLNQVILGGDPMMTSIDSMDAQIEMMENYRKRLQQLKSQQQQAAPAKLIWDDIDAEVNPMTEEQRNMLLMDEDYVEIYNKLQGMVQAEILNIVKGRIEATEEGKSLLEKQLKIVRRLKSKIIQETNREMEMFRKFKEFSKNNPGVTYEEFIKANM